MRDIPYFFQIGFDFGTSLSKIIIRDVNEDYAWVYIQDESDKRSFLIPSSVYYISNTFSRNYDYNDMYSDCILSLLKMRVMHIAEKYTDFKDFITNSDKSKDSIYVYNDETGLQKVIEYNELKYNDNAIYYLWK